MDFVHNLKTNLMKMIIICMISISFSLSIHAVDRAIFKFWLVMSLSEGTK